MKIKEVDEFKLENFYLSELSAVVSLYKQHIGKCYSQDKDEMKTCLTPQFGLPLAVIIKARQVIGYAAAIITPLNKIELNCIFYPEFQNEEFRVRLELKAKRNLMQIFGEDDQSLDKLKSAIERLVYWLNL